MRRYIMILSIFSTFLLASCQSTPRPVELAPSSALTSDLLKLPERTQVAYRFALANPDILQKIPCYCGCVGIGHQDNYQCYIQSTQNDLVQWDPHAALCQICVDITWDVMDRLEKGISLHTIRAYIDQAYQNVGIPTNTDPI